MKHLLTISALLISSLAMGQWPSLPYNPDDNADGLIGVADLQTLLSNYGSEFSSAVVSEDGESAIVYMGAMGYPHCKYSCDQLPGFWALPELEDLVPVWDEVYSTNTFIHTWVKADLDHYEVAPESFARYPYFYSRNQSGSNYHTIEFSGALTSNKRCYCAAKQLPRVEYSYCQSGNIQVCAAEKVESGWYPIPGASSILNNAPGYSGYYEKTFQAFWRWAE